MASKKSVFKRMFGKRRKATTVAKRKGGKRKLVEDSALNFVTYHRDVGAKEGRRPRNLNVVKLKPKSEEDLCDVSYIRPKATVAKLKDKQKYRHVGGVTETLMAMDGFI